MVSIIIIIIHNMSSVALKKNSGLRMGSYIETITPRWQSMQGWT